MTTAGMSKLRQVVSMSILFEIDAGEHRNRIGNHCVVAQCEAHDY